MFLGSYITQHGSSQGSNVCSSDCRGDVVVTGSNICSKRSKSVEWSLVTPLELITHILWNLVEGDMSRTFVHYLYILLPRTLCEIALKLELKELGLVVRIKDGSRSKTISNRKSDVVLSTDVKDLIPVFVGKVLLVMEDIPLGMDTSSTGNNTSQTVYSGRNKAEKNSGMDGEVINTLLSLLDESLTEGFPSQVLCNAINLLKCLINGNCSYRNRRVTNDPFTCLLNVLPGTQVHEGICSPKSTPLQFLHLLFNRRSNSRVSDISIDLDLEHTSNDLRLKFKMFLVAADNGTSSSNLRANKLGLNSFTFSDKEHLFSDHSLLGEVHLSVTLVLSFPGLDPLRTNLRDSLLRVNITGAGGIIKVEERHIFILEVNATERNIKRVPRFLMYNSLVLFRRVRECVTVRNISNTLKLGVERIESRLGSGIRLDVCFPGN
mmetsp:Transcript_651/g.1028  ORF Transcript_651/g.1028 Transcript_651/m.1028 type:complete len:435 (+) Transcript_651:690-1994(+)